MTYCSGIPIQWDLSITDTLGPEKTVCYTEFSTIRRLFYMHNNLSGPTPTVCYREVFAVRGVCYKRLHCTSLAQLNTHYPRDTYIRKDTGRKASSPMQA